MDSVRTCLCFNPRTRESATGLENASCGLLHVSIHALVRVRRQKDDIALYRIGFNPRTRESATYDYYPDEHEIHVSIHALVRVRHIMNTQITLKDNVSIHALVRVRLKALPLMTLKTLFQSTHS